MWNTWPITSQNRPIIEAHHGLLTHEPFRNLLHGLLREFLREFLRRFFMPFSGGNTPEPFILRSEPFRNLYMGCYVNSYVSSYVSSYVGFSCLFQGGIPLNRSFSVMNRSEPFRGEVKTAKNHVRNHVRNQAKKNSPWKGLDRLGSLPVCHGLNQWPLTTCALP